MRNSIQTTLGLVRKFFSLDSFAESLSVENSPVVFVLYAVVDASQFFYYCQNAYDEQACGEIAGVFSSDCQSPSVRMPYLSVSSEMKMNVVND